MAGSSYVWAGTAGHQSRGCVRASWHGLALSPCVQPLPGLSFLICQGKMISQKWVLRPFVYIVCHLTKRKGFLHVPCHPNSSNGAFALLFLWLLMLFYVLALFDIPFPDLAGSWWRLFSCSSVWFQNYISGSQVFKYPGLPRMVTLQAHALWQCSGPAFWTGSWTVVLLPQPLLWCTCSPWHSEVPQCQSWVRAERIAGACPNGGWRRRELVESGNILNWIYSFWLDYLLDFSLNSLLKIMKKHDLVHKVEKDHKL